MTTITEDWVSVEVANLLKERGFDEACFAFYYVMPHRTAIAYDSNFPKNSDLSLIYTNQEFGSLPTHQTACKWLRKKHKLHIQIWILEGKGYWFDIEKILNAQYKHKSLYSSGLENIYFNSPEQACDEAIKYCIENLI